MLTFVGALVVVLFVTAFAITAIRWRHGVRPGPAALLGLPLLALGAAAWTSIAAEPAAETTWTWVVVLFLGIIALASTIDPVRAARALIATAAAFPIAIAVHLFWLRATDAPVALDGTDDLLAYGVFVTVAYCPAALATWVVLRFGERTAGGRSF